MIINSFGGTEKPLDLGCCLQRHLMCSILLSHSTVAAGTVAIQAQDQKNTKYRFLNRHPCMPVVMETSGVIVNTHYHNWGCLKALGT